MLKFGTFRKLQIFGNEYEKNVNFEWPMAPDILQLRSLEDLQLTSLSWKQFNGFLNGIQLHFQNDLSSPMVLANNCTDEFFRTEMVADTQLKSVEAYVFKFGNLTHGILGL